MSHVPQGPPKTAAWRGFGVLCLVLAFAFPQLLGLFLGIGGALALIFVIYKALGGQSGLFK